MAQKKKDKKKEGTITCIWCYSPLTPKETATHPCTQPNFLESDKVKYAKMIHPSHQSEWQKVEDWLRPNPSRQFPDDDDEFPPWSCRPDDDDDRWRGE